MEVLQVLAVEDLAAAGLEVTKLVLQAASSGLMEAASLVDLA